MGQAQLDDEILRATGGPTVNDGLATWFSKTKDESLQDAEMRFLSGKLVLVSATIQDRWYAWLSLTYSGSLNDMKLAYWSAQP